MPEPTKTPETSTPSSSTSAPPEPLDQAEAWLDRLLERKLLLDRFGPRRRTLLLVLTAVAAAWCNRHEFMKLGGGMLDQVAKNVPAITSTARAQEGP